VRWSERVAARRKKDARVITEYEFDLEAAGSELQIIRFDRPDETWLDFVCANRSGRTLSKPYDIAIGPVADDSVYATVLLYEMGILDIDAAIKQLKVSELFSQILFHTEKSLRFCRFVKYETIGGN
jgi:hypothetical protein